MGVIEDLKEKGAEEQFLHYFYRYFSKGVSRKLARTKITPNQVTLLQLLFGCLAGFLFSKATYLYLILGAISLQISIFLDYVDGEIARIKGLTSIAGEWLEVISALIIDFAYISGMTWCAYQMRPLPISLILGGLFLAFHFMICSSYSATLLVVPFAKDFPSEIEKKFLRHFIYSKMNIILLATIFAILKRPLWYLIVGSIYSGFFLISLMAILWIKIKKMEAK